MRILTASDVRQLLPMSAAIEAVRDGYVALSHGHATVPVRGMMMTADGTTLTMPAHITGESVSVVKLVGIFDGNPARGLPTIHAVLLVTDAATGVPLLLSDAGALTAIRTGAGSGVATDLLALPDASVLACIGAGAQGRTQVEGVCAVRHIREIRLYSRGDSAQQMADEIQGRYDATVTVAETVAEATTSADVICLATNSSSPVIHLDDVKPGAHINGVGSYKPTMQEAAADLVTANHVQVIVDHRESIWEEAGDLIIPRDAGQFADEDIVAEIGQVVAGDVQGRTSDDQITFFKSVGNAVQDAAVAKVLLNALQANPDVGSEAPL
ncbi:MAG: ornithine cyclodeaminase [Chloroflexota bacterium]